jgi:hypothetical protein
MERNREQLDAFDMILTKPNNKNLFYAMKLLKDVGEEYYTADYSYGSCGARGKSYFKSFSKYTAERKGITAAVEARQFFQDKKNELIAKGYVNAGEVDNSVKLRPGEHIYLEWRDMYSAERSFYDIELSACGKYLYEQEGDFHGKSVEHEYDVDNMEPDYVNERVKGFRERGYRNKTRPKNLPTKVIHAYGCDFEESSSGDEDDDKSEDAAPKAKKTAAPAKGKGKGKGKAAAGKKRKTKKDDDDESDDERQGDMDGSGSEMGWDEIEATVKQNILKLQKQLKEGDSATNKKDAAEQAKVAYPNPSSPVTTSRDGNADAKGVNRPKKKPKPSEDDLIKEHLREYIMNYKG